MQAPKYWNGKTKVYEEVFKGPHAYESMAEAEKKLEAIRKAHPESSGWHELESGIDQTEEGWTVYRHHAQYK